MDVPPAGHVPGLVFPVAGRGRVPDGGPAPGADVKVMFDSSDGIFGHRMVHTKLAAAGIEVSVGTVAVIMAENGWSGWSGTGHFIRIGSWGIRSGGGNISSAHDTVITRPAAIPHKRDCPSRSDLH